MTASTSAGHPASGGVENSDPKTQSAAIELAASVHVEGLPSPSMYSSDSYTARSASLVHKSRGSGTAPNSNAPESHAGPYGRGAPRWSKNNGKPAALTHSSCEVDRDAAGEKCVRLGRSTIVSKWVKVERQPRERRPGRSRLDQTRRCCPGFRCCHPRKQAAPASRSRPRRSYSSSSSRSRSGFP